MTFTITQEDAVPIPPKHSDGAPAAFGLDTLQAGKMAFVPVSAHSATAEIAKTSMAKATMRLGLFPTSAACWSLAVFVDGKWASALHSTTRLFTRPGT